MEAAEPMARAEAGALAKDHMALVLGQLTHGALEVYPDEDRLREGDPGEVLEYLNYEVVAAVRAIHGHRQLIPATAYAAAQELVLFRSGFGGRYWIYHSGEEGWAWYPRGSHPHIILAPARDFDSARWSRDEARRRERVAVAHELAVAFANTFPREIIIQIYLEVFWGA